MCFPTLYAEFFGRYFTFCNRLILLTMCSACFTARSDVFNSSKFVISPAAKIFTYPLTCRNSFTYVKNSYKIEKRPHIKLLFSTVWVEAVACFTLMYLSAVSSVLKCFCIYFVHGVSTHQKTYLNMQK